MNQVCRSLIIAWLLAGIGIVPGRDFSVYRLDRQRGETSVLDPQHRVVGAFVPWTNASVSATDHVEVVSTNLLLWTRTFSLKPGQKRQAVRLQMDFRVNHATRFAVIPGISWNGNTNDPGNVYHGFADDGVPWSFASHRTLIPGATYSEGESYSVGLFAEVPDSASGLACALVRGEQTTVHRLIIPEEEMPRRVLLRERGLSPGRTNVLELSPGQSYPVRAWLVLHPAERPRTGYRFLLDAAWEHFYKPTRPRHDLDSLRAMGLRFAKESLWDSQARMFHLALQCTDGRQWSQAGGFSIGWCGRNGELAVALLEDYAQSGDTNSLEIGLSCLDAWAARVPDLPLEEPADAKSRPAWAQPFTGQWTVTYDNGAVARLRFESDGHIGAHPTWGTGQLRVSGEQQLACDWSNGQKEQYKLSGDTLEVEHWFEGKKYIGHGRRSEAIMCFAGIATDANTLADGATAFLRAAQWTERARMQRPRYRAIGLGICDAALALQRADGRFEGPGCERGAIGAAFIPPLLTAYEMTQQGKYLTAARSALDFYMGVLYREGFLWGGALDTRSIDKETSLPLLAGAVRFHGLQHDAAVLRQGEDAAYYFAAWQMAQSIPNVPGSLMDRIGYDTFGGTSVATVHMCADPFGLAAVPYLLKLADYTHKTIWRQRALALWNNASQGISDGSLVLNGLPPRPCGSQDETVNYTDWGYDFLAQGMDRLHPRGAGQCWLTAWPTAMRLTILADPEIARQLLH